MPGTTTNFGWPYQLLTDPPNGASLGASGFQAADTSLAAEVTARAALPRGIIARVARTTNGAGSTTGTGGTAASQGLVTLSAAMIAGRLYRVFTESFNLFTSTAPSTQVSMQVELRYTTNGATPDGTATALNEINSGTMMGNGNFDQITIGGLYVPTANITFKAWLGYWRTLGSGATVQSAGNASQPVVLAIEDMGIDPGTGGGTIL